MQFNSAKSLKLGYPSHKMDQPSEHLFKIQARYSLEPSQLTANNFNFREFNLNMHYFKIAVDVTRRILHILQLVDILWMISHQWDWIFNTTTKYIWITAEVQVTLDALEINISWKFCLQLNWFAILSSNLTTFITLKQK